MTFPDSFGTARLRATRLGPEHEVEIHLMHQDPVQMASLGGTRDVAATEAYMERNLQHWAEHGFGVWLLWHSTTGAFVGRALLRHLTVDGVDEIEVGYAIRPAWWGQGLASEIAGTCLALGRSEFGFRSIIGLTLPDNLRSQRVLTRIGMVVEREALHEAQRHLLFRWNPEAGFDPAHVSS